LDIFDKIETHFKAQKPFVVYRKPNEDIVSGFFQKNDSLFFTDDFTTAGFVFSPFNNIEQSILIPENDSEFQQEELTLDIPLSKENKNFVIDESSKENHINLVEKSIQEITENQFKKVVVSRKETQNITDFNLITTYKKLLHTYSNAFGYVWFHPKVGLWLGATPETLLNISDTHFKTMSLAGTQVYKDTENVTWQSKELEEQELVTTFITSQISEIAINLEIDKKETIKAGNLLHLRTKISGTILVEKSNLKTLINALHPTPAVCGLPRKETKEFILKNESYKRTFYTGFLGELNLKDKISNVKKSSLFVNLRCMEIINKQAVIYVGGGITKNSNAIKEWEETVSKSKVMKAVL
jgi:isochorismate synthase